MDASSIHTVGDAVAAYLTQVESAQPGPLHFLARVVLLVRPGLLPAVPPEPVDLLNALPISVLDEVGPLRARLQKTEDLASALGLSPRTVRQLHRRTVSRPAPLDLYGFPASDHSCFDRPGAIRGIE